MITSPRFLQKRSKEEQIFNSIFSPYRHTWSSPFTVNKLGDQLVSFRVHHAYYGDEEKGGLMGNHRTRRTSRGAAGSFGAKGAAHDSGSSSEGEEGGVPDRKEPERQDAGDANGVMKNTLSLSVGHHGKTKRLSFNLPDQMSSKAVKKMGNDVNVIIRVPQLELGLLGEVSG
jgi:hypothetical protein